MMETTVNNEMSFIRYNKAKSKSDTKINESLFKNEMSKRDLSKNNSKIDVSDNTRNTDNSSMNDKKDPRYSEGTKDSISKIDPNIRKQSEDNISKLDDRLVGYFLGLVDYNDNINLSDVTEIVSDVSIKPLEADVEDYNVNQNTNEENIFKKNSLPIDDNNPKNDAFNGNDSIKYDKTKLLAFKMKNDNSDMLNSNPIDKVEDIKNDESVRNIDSISLTNISSSYIHTEKNDGNNEKNFSEEYKNDDFKLRNNLDDKKNRLDKFSFNNVLSNKPKQEYEINIEDDIDLDSLKDGFINKESVDKIKKELINIVERNLHKDINSLKIKLNPKNLGEIFINIKHNQKDVIVTITAHEKLTHKLLIDHSNDMAGILGKHLEDNVKVFVDNKESDFLNNQNNNNKNNRRNHKQENNKDKNDDSFLERLRLGLS